MSSLRAKNPRIPYAYHWDSQTRFNLWSLDTSVKRPDSQKESDIQPPVVHYGNINTRFRT
jgi:hypothetical protein